VVDGAARRGSVEVPVVEFIDVHTALGGRWVLTGVDFAVRRNAVTVLLGPSGVGKTTCIKHLLGLHGPDEGDVLIEGRSLFARRESELAALRRRFGVLLQGYGVYGGGLWESLTALENIVHQLRELRVIPREGLEERAYDRLAEVGLGAHWEALPGDMSAGMRKRLGLARALASDPEFAVLDDFDSGVDGVRIAGLCELVRRRRQATGGTYLITTHDMEVARELADDIVVLAGGRVADAGPAAAVFASRVPVARQLVSGERNGPIGLADPLLEASGRTGPSGPSGPPGPPRPRPDTSPFDLPLWLVGVVLVAATAVILIVIARIGGST
jgi:phospholipid/cholesterol/gamma-HCH transport system ATP-binding protein